MDLCRGECELSVVSGSSESTCGGGAAVGGSLRGNHEMQIDTLRIITHHLLIDQIEIKRSLSHAKMQYLTVIYEKGFSCITAN